MITRLKRKNSLGNERGFTLIEMAVVLIIIGLIVGAVVKGKDIISSAKQKKMYAKFVQTWQLSYNTYYDKTGWILGDISNDDNQGTRDGRCGDGNTASCDNLVAQLIAVGLTPPSFGTTGSACIRNYRDSEDRSYALTLAFKFDADIGNYLEISDNANGFPSELGIAWDNIIDSQRGGNTGDFLYDADGSIVANGFAQWPAATENAVSASVAVLKLQF
ncbi:MAG: prepilin-type N-terminal cleavage/methylation domain-containing protein [Desulfobacteraceae bacterium]|nr:prepilin-type N-terminal cleavage/methylation domain-containing protein [Desulfobacteraceae bacterium]